MDKIEDYALTNQVEVFNSILEALPQSMFLLNSQKDIIGIYNASPESLAGYTVDEIIGVNLMQIVNDDTSPFRQACSMLNDTFESVYRTGVSLKFQYTILENYFEATITKISGDRILSQVRDITDIVSKQQSIERKKHVELAMALMAGGLTSWSYDVCAGIISTKHDNKIVGHETTLEGLLLRIDKKYSDKVRAMFSDILHRGVLHGQITVHMHNVEGEYCWVDVHAVPFEYDADGGVSVIIGSQKDVTAEYEYNSRMRKLARQNELILNNTNSGFVYLTADLKIEWENATKIFSDPEIVCLFAHGRLCDGGCEFEPECCRKTIIHALEEGERCTGKVQTTSNLIIEAIAQPVMGADGSVVGVVLRLDDVTDKELAMGQLARAKEQAEQSDTLKSAFLANMSHEIRTPLNSIVGFAQLIPQAVDEEEQQGFIDVVNSNSEVLLNLINDILDLSKIEAGYFNCNNSIFNLSELFSELELMFAYKPAPGVVLSCSLPYPEFHVNLDRMRISQVITNFTTNALKFTKQGHIDMGYEVLDGKVRIYVEDTGMGMSEDEAKRVFNRFEKFNLFEQGTGLGTAIAKAIVDAYGGEIGVQSTPNKGSIFWAVFPIGMSEDDIFVGKAVEDADADLALRDCALVKVLVAEDNDSNYMLVRALLRGYNLTRAYNGAEAVELSLREQFDIVLMDMRMPVMDGLEATKLIRGNDPRIPIIAVTANAFDEDRKMAFEVGVSDFLTKPLNRAKLLDVIARFAPRVSRGQ